MTDERTEAARRVFMEIAELRGPARDAALAEACGDDAALRAEVEALLRAESQAGGFMRDPTHTAVGGEQAAIATVATPPREQPGQMIDRYKLLQPIGEGGFGSVWMAEQREPVKRRVALKIIKLGMDTKQVIARFEAERQALAMMDHPNIAKVFDAGATDTGRPYFAMEYIKGVPIIEYCDTEKLNTRARLDLFMKVCHAIQHAHQKGIIHRDIKPSNVMVTLHDGVPVPKVIDFGIAKATNSELTSKTLFTEHRQMIGTPAYMSPEQAEMSGLDIDTRSDVYSLGVLLYELLTGTTPFATEELLEKGFAEMMRIIREVEPHKPSTRLSSLGATGTRTAQQRHVADVAKLGLLMRGDLDWIVMKCLEKDRTRRYETANGLAADIRRHLSDEPVLAGPPSARYKLRKFIRRNRSGVIAATVVLAVLVLGVIGTTSGMVWALNERDRADTEATRANLAATAEVEQRQIAESNEQKAIEEAERAERELARATEIKRLITEMLTSVDPKNAQGADTTLLKGLLDDAAARLDKGEITDELIAAELHQVIGEVYWRLGLFPQAEAHLPVAQAVRQRVLGEEHPQTLASMNNLANLYWSQGRYAEAESLHIETLAIRRRVLGAEHRETLGSMINLGSLHARQGRYDEAESLLLEALEKLKRIMGEEDDFTRSCMVSLAVLYNLQSRYAEAEPLYLKVLEIRKRVLGEEHPQTLYSASVLAIQYRQQSRYAEAEVLFLKALDGQRRVLGEEHPNTLNSMNNLANLYSDQGRYAEAESLLLKALDIQKGMLGEDHPDTLDSMHNLADLYQNQGRYAEAEPLYTETLEISIRVLGEEHPYTLISMHNLALLYRNLGRFAEAEQLYLDTLEIKKRVLGAEHLSTLMSMNNLALLYGHQDRYAEAEPLYAEALEIKKRVHGEEHPSTLLTMMNLGYLYNSMGRHEDATELLETSLSLQRRVLGSQHARTSHAIRGLATAYEALGRRDEAIPLRREMLDLQIAAAEAPDASARALNTAAWSLLTHHYEELDDPARALAYAQRACAAEEAAGGDNLWTYLDTLALAQHQTGDSAVAVETQKRAIALMPTENADPEVHTRLATYQAALVAQPRTHDEDQ